jgi:hypothetical protein
MTTNKDQHQHSSSQKTTKYQKGFDMLSTAYSFGKVLSKPFPMALDAVQKSLKEVSLGWREILSFGSGSHLETLAVWIGVIATIDFQSTFREKLGKETLRSVSLGACNPALVWKIYESDETAAALLPCHVLVQEQKSKSQWWSLVKCFRHS